MYAKLFETEIGQLLVKQDTGDNGVEVRVFFEPEGYGVCSISFDYKDDPEDLQWEKTDKLFNEMTEEKCTKLIKTTLASLAV